MWAIPTTFPPYFNSTVCTNPDINNGEPKDFTGDAFGWFECMAPQRDAYRAANQRDNVDVYTPVKQRLNAGVHVTTMLCAFCVLTSITHLLLAIHDEAYQRRLNLMLQPWRWLEYSVTASLMLWCDLALSQVEDAFLLTSLFINAFFLNFVGGALFEFLYYGERNCVELHDGVHIKAWFRYLKWFAFFTSWSAYIVNVVTSWDSFNSVVHPLITHPVVGPFFDELLTNVAQSVNVGITVSYATFPIIHCYSFWPYRKNANQVRAYRFGEKLFILASFVSKSLLVLLIGVTAFLRSDEAA